jgi:SAM-dependent methyltransferase
MRLNVRVPDFDGDEYQARFDALAHKGVDVHGEADFVRSFNPRTVLDAGCGTGRVAIELARHGIDAVGADMDRSMLAVARERAPEIEWVEVDLSTMALDRTFDVVVLAGNVPIFCPEPSRAALVSTSAAHVAPGGRLIAGFQLDRGYALGDWDRDCHQAGMSLVDRWSTWDRQPFHKDDSYAVSVHER